MPVYDLATGPGGEPALTLVLLHHAGGSARGFAPFLPHLPRTWRVWGADLPGRLLDSDGRCCRTAQEAVGRLHRELVPQLTGPYVLFGHSMGALLGYELARVLEAEGRGPRLLGVSGSLAPRLCGTGRRGVRPAGRTPDGLRSPGGGPAGAVGPAALADRAARTLRRDLQLVDGYAYREGPPLRTALSVFGGSGDRLAPPHLLPAWSAHARRAVAYHLWPGGHLYLFEHAEAVCARLVHDCRTHR